MRGGGEVGAEEGDLVDEGEDCAGVGLDESRGGGGAAGGKVVG